MSLNAKSLGDLPVRLDPNARDYESIRQYMMSLIPTLTEEWTDLYPGDPGVVLLEAVSAVADMLHYHIDRAQNESFLLTAQQRQNVIDICRLIDYELPAGTSASTSVEVTTSGPVTIPALTSLYSTSQESPSLRFEFLNNVVIPSAGTWDINDIPELVVTHGETISNETIGVSNGSARQRFQFGRGPLALKPDGSNPITIRVNSVPWSSVRTFRESSPSDKHYKFTTDRNGTTTIRFGDGVNGAIPSEGSAIVATYRIGGGTEGNSVGRNTLTKLGTTFPAVDSITNPQQPSGGSNPQSIREAKIQAPMSLRALNRAVELTDYETLAREVSGVRAAHATHDDSAYRVAVYIAAEGPNPVPSGTWFPKLSAGSGLLGQVGRYFDGKKATPWIDVRPVSVVRPRMKAEIVLKSNYLRSDINSELSERLIGFFEDRSSDFGNAVPQSDVVGLVENTRGVDYINVEEFFRLPNIRFIRGKEAAYDDSTYLFGQFSESMAADTYSIEWLNGVTYRLFGSSSGYVRDELGEIRHFIVGTPYNIVRYRDTDDPTKAKQAPQFSILINAPTYPSPGDVWEFGVDSFRGNIDVAPYEMVVPTIVGESGLLEQEFNLRYTGGIG